MACILVACHPFSLTDPGPEHQLMQLAIASLVTFDKVCRRNGRHLPPAELSQLQQAGQAFLTAYNALALNAAAQQERLWKLVPKFHMFTHLLWDQSRVANPRSVHNYLDESMIGFLKKIASACHPTAISYRVVSRYLVWTAVRWYMSVLRK